jgi:hypothetical protein
MVRFLVAASSLSKLPDSGRAALLVVRPVRCNQLSVPYRLSEAVNLDAVEVVDAVCQL